MGKKGEVGKTSYDQISPVILGQQSFADMVAKDKANKSKAKSRDSKRNTRRPDPTWPPNGSRPPSKRLPRRQTGWCSLRKRWFLRRA